MIATLLIVFAMLNGSQAYAPSPPVAYAAAPSFAVSSPIMPVTLGLASSTASPLVAPSDVITYYVFLPYAAKPPGGCAPITGAQYGTLTVSGGPPNPPAEQN